MPSNLTLYSANKSLELMVGKTAFVKPTTYIGAFTIIPDEDGAGGTEASAGNYARIITAGADWNSAAAGAIDNANDITFAECTGSAWGLLVGIGIWDAISAGNMIFWMPLGFDKQINVGNTFRLEAGEINITAD